MIDIQQLRFSDKGREVRYRAKGGELTEWGTIAYWSQKLIFVRYHTRQYDGELIKLYRSHTSQATDPRDLEFTT